MFLQGASTREDFLLTLDSAKITRYMPKNADSGIDFDEGIRREKTESSDHFFYSPPFLGAFRGHTEYIKIRI